MVGRNFVHSCDLAVVPLLLSIITATHSNPAKHTDHSFAMSGSTRFQAKNDPSMIGSDKQSRVPLRDARTLIDSVAYGGTDQILLGEPPKARTSLRGAHRYDKESSGEKTLGQQCSSKFCWRCEAIVRCRLRVKNYI